MTGRLNGAEPQHNGEFDPFTVPHATHTLADAAVRSHVVVHGTVQAVEPVLWAGGPVVEVTLADPTAAIILVFLGRHRVAGLEPGRQLTVAGTVGTHQGRRVILNPALWLSAEPAIGTHRGSPSDLRPRELAASN